jgi:RNA polymerase sigma-54 factor
MSYPISLDQLAKQHLSVKQTQRMIMSPQMQQAIHMLQMPTQELNELIENELQQNPVIDLLDSEATNDEDLEYEKDDAIEKELNFNEHDLEILKKLDDDLKEHFVDASNHNSAEIKQQEKLKNFLESSIPVDVSLFEYVFNQAKELFSEQEELDIAEAIIGNFDENGFLKISLSEISLLNSIPVPKLQKILKVIQTLDPVGIGAKSLQESLLLQLERKNKKDSLAYKIVDKHYNDLLHNHIPLIKKGLKCSNEDILSSIKTDIARLDLHPGLNHCRHLIQYIIPDASILLDDEKLIVSVNDESLPPFKVNKHYLKLLEDNEISTDAKDFIKSKLFSAKWLIKNLHQRNETLYKIIHEIAEIQRNFFLEPKGDLTPLTMKSIAEKLGLHESTIARAVSNKYINTPKGIFSLRSFFTSALANFENEDVSSNTVKIMLKEIIDKEDKKKPLSDDDLSKLLTKKGISCARRTVTKYRQELNIGSSHHRKEYT